MSLERPPDPSFVRLREELFRGQLAARMVALDREAEPLEVNVGGVVIEIGTEDKTILVYAMRDGTASMYWSSGGVMVGGRDRPRIAEAAKALVVEARKLLAAVPPVVEHPLPEPGRVRISILTSDGVLAAEDEEKALMAGKSVLYPLFLRGNDVVNGFRTEQRPNTNPPAVTKEMAYVTCLLTALARGPVSSVSLFQGAPLPDPAAFTSDLRDLEWFGSLKLDLASLSMDAIISYVYIHAGFRELPRQQIESRLRATLQSYEGSHRKTFEFRITQQELRGKFGLEIALMSD